MSRSTAIPKPFKVEIEVRVANCAECERQLHNMLVKYNVGKEFYNISVQKVRKIIDRSFEYIDRIDYLRKLMDRY